MGENQVIFFDSESALDKVPQSSILNYANRKIIANISAGLCLDPFADTIARVKILTGASFDISIF